MRRLCGPTFARSQDENSEAVRTWWSGASPARTCPSPASAAGSTPGAAASSSTSCAPLTTYDPATSTWRTSQPSLWDASLTPFSGRWPTSGLMLAGAAYERPTLGRRMAAIGGGASRGTAHNWPTPDAGVINDGQDPATFHAWRAKMKEKHGNGNGHGTPLAIAAADAVQNWPTPTAGDSWTPSGDQSAERETNKHNLRGTALTYDNWPTPSVADTMGGHLSRGGDRSEELLLPGMAQRVADQLAAWNTPRARDWKAGGFDSTLTDQTEKWSTPRASDGEKGGPNQSWTAGGTPLPTQAVHLSGPLAQPIAGRGRPFSLGGRTLRPQLSALFVEWLMGVPLGMTCVCAIGETG